MRSFSKSSVASGVLALATVASAQAPAKVSLDHAVKFGQGTAQMRAGLQGSDATRDVVKDQFGVAAEDLNGDGANEIILLSLAADACNGGVCKSVILEKRGEQMVPIFSGRLARNLGVGRESVGGYRTLVAHDGNGGVATTTTGRQVVFQIASTASAAGAASANAPSVAKAPAAAARTEPAPPSGGAFDVVGIRLGMSYDAALTAFRAALPGVEGVDGATEYRGSPPVKVIFYHSGGKAGEAIHFALSGPPSAPTVVEVLREVGYDKGKQPNYSVLLESLTEKYGKPSFIDVNRRAHVWFLDNVGANNPAITRAGVCAPASVSSRNVDNYAANLGTAPVPNGTGLHRLGCGRVLYVNVYPTQANSEVVETLQVYLSDFPAAIEAENKTREYLVQAAERLRAKEADAARGNKPTL